jgi:hypothetical protein
MRESREPEDLLRWSRKRRESVGKNTMIPMGSSRCKVLITEHIRGTLFLGKTYEKPEREVFVRQEKMTPKPEWSIQKFRESR